LQKRFQSRSVRRTGAHRPNTLQPYLPQSAEFNVDAHICHLAPGHERNVGKLGNGRALADIDQVPVVLMDEINKTIEDKTGFTQVQSANLKAKGKKGHKKG
jgi:hypothetical protein